MPYNVVRTQLKGTLLARFLDTLERQGWRTVSVVRLDDEDGSYEVISRERNRK